MATKRVDPLKAKQAKQRKMAIGLGLVLVAVLVFQVPRTLKMLKGPQPVAAAAPAAPATTTGTTTTPNAAPTPAPAAGAPVPAAGLPPVAGEAQPAVLVDSDIPAGAGAGQLRSFERFQTKDPFVQQDAAKVEPAAPAPKPATTPEVTSTTPTDGSGSMVTAPGSASSPGSAPGTTTPDTPEVALAAATSISVNGVAEDVATEASFPAASPVFVLVSLAKDGKSVQLGIAGGAYADGAATIKLALGKPLTLRNTADGTRYVLLLQTVAGFAPPAAAKQK